MGALSGVLVRARGGSRGSSPLLILLALMNGLPADHLRKLGIAARVRLPATSSAAASYEWCPHHPRVDHQTRLSCCPARPLLFRLPRPLQAPASPLCRTPPPRSATGLSHCSRTSARRPRPRRRPPPSRPSAPPPLDGSQSASQDSRPAGCRHANPAAVRGYAQQLRPRHQPRKRSPDPERPPSSSLAADAGPQQAASWQAVAESLCRLLPVRPLAGLTIGLLRRILTRLLTVWPLLRRIRRLRLPAG